MRLVSLLFVLDALDATSKQRGTTVGLGQKAQAPVLKTFSGQTPRKNRG